MAFGSKIEPDHKSLELIRAIASPTIAPETICEVFDMTADELKTFTDAHSGEIIKEKKHFEQKD